jgi:type I restriction enzyme S subunit
MQVEAADIFVPPIAEQRRVVAKVDELLGVCDRLEESLRAGGEHRSGLLRAILAEALQPATDQDAAA